MMFAGVVAFGGRVSARLNNRCTHLIIKNSAASGVRWLPRSLVTSARTHLLMLRLACLLAYSAVKMISHCHYRPNTNGHASTEESRS
jgi:hypothetical protein